MYNSVIVVEDEDILRKLFIQAIDWQAYQCKLVYDCASAEQAIEYVEQNGPPDILFTDICMLQKSGLDLCCYFHEKHPQTYKVILTGYSEFEYAKQAIEYEVKEYLLKPVSTDAVHALLEQYSNELFVLRHNKQELEKIRHLIQKNRHTHIENLLSDIVANVDDYNEEEFLPIAQELGFSLENYFYIAIKFQMDSSASEHLPVLLQLRSFLQEQLSFLGACYLFSLEYRQFCCVVIPNKPDTSPETFLKQAFDKIPLFNKNITYSAGISMEQHGFETLHIANEQATIACNYDFYFGPKSITTFQPIFIQRRNPDYIENLNDNKIIAKLQVGNWVDAIELIDKKMNEIRHEKAISIGTLQSAAVELVTNIYKKIHLVSPDSSSYDFSNDVLQVTNASSIDEVQVALSAVIKSCGKKVQNNFFELTNEAVVTILEYINQNYHRRVTLDDLSQLVYLNQKYICAIIKKDTGKTFYEILTEVRIRKAQELLYDPTVKMYQIAQMVGFYDTKAFNSAFRKIVNTTPSLYRKDILEKAKELFRNTDKKYKDSQKT